MNVSLEGFISPIVNHLNYLNSKGISPEDKQFLDKIKKQKFDVIEERIEPSQADLVRSEVVESWIRSARNGLHPYRFTPPPLMDEQSFSQLINKKKFLLQAAELYISQMEKMLSQSDTYIFLSDEQGVILHVVQSLGDNRFRLLPGTIWNEETIGTCTHGLCILLKRPIQLSGPEHFSQIFGQVTCSSAPIFNYNGHLEGTLTITSPYLHNQNSQTLGLAVTMAMAIQNELQILIKDELLDVALSTTINGVLFINELGHIVEANTIAKSIFEPLGVALEGSPYQEVLGTQPLIEDTMAQGKAHRNENLIIKKLKHKKFSSSIQPVNSLHSKNWGCIVNLKPAECVKNAKAAKDSVIRFNFDNIVGSSPQTQKLITLAKRFARTDANILLLGDSGTGKEVYAQAIHCESRPDGPYVAVNCAAIPANLIESELFGYEGGAFTGADRQGKPGKFELANGGTLFLDEIGDMPLELQAVLLRALEDKMITHVGGSRSIPVDFRLIAATNKNLYELMEKKLFREDLYYRLSTFKLNIPPLKERGSDIVQLIDSFLESYAQMQEIPVPTLNNAAKYLLLQYGWPGNVRQLKNIIYYAVCMCNDGIILPEHLPDEIQNYRPSSVNAPTIVEAKPDKEAIQENVSIKELEKVAIIKALEDSNNHIREAAKILGLSKSTLYRRLKEYDLLK